MTITTTTSSSSTGKSRRFQQDRNATDRRRHFYLWTVLGLTLCSTREIAWFAGNMYTNLSTAIFSGAVSKNDAVLNVERIPKRNSRSVHGTKNHKRKQNLLGDDHHRSEPGRPTQDNRQSAVRVMMATTAFDSLTHSTVRSTPGKRTMKKKRSDSDPVAVAHAAIPQPLQVLQEYIQQHSVNVVGQPSSLQDLMRGDRKYIVTAYSCPHRAGNMMGVYLNSLLLAILTNRTALWNFMGSTTLQRKECDTIVSRAAWLPAFPQGIPETAIYRFYQREQVLDACEATVEHVRIFNNVTGLRGGIDRNPSRCQDYLRKVPSGIETFLSNIPPLKVQLHEHKVILPKGTTGCLHALLPGWEGRFDMNHAHCAAYIRHIFGPELIDNDRIEKLFRYGMDYVYGMLYRHSFTWQESFINNIQTEPPAFDPSVFSVGLHSRHTHSWDDGTNVTREAACLDLVLAKRQQHRKQQAQTKSTTSSSSCQIFIMSDRMATLEQLKDYATRNDCQAVTVAQHPESNTSSSLIHGQQFQDEHGPFHSAGFYRDFYLIAQARNGFVGTDRSSSGFIQQVMIYDRMMEQWHDQPPPTQPSETDPSVVANYQQSPDDFFVCHFDFTGFNLPPQIVIPVLNEPYDSTTLLAASSYTTILQRAIRYLRRLLGVSW